jgi:hypothetical protein
MRNERQLAAETSRVGLLRCLGWVALIFCATATAGIPARSPSAIVREFLVDYSRWNHDAFVARASGVSDVHEAEAAYKLLLKKYCKPGFRGEPIAFSSQPLHSPEDETIASDTIDGSQSIVRTRHKTIQAGTEVIDTYEYHFFLENGHWYLEQVYYVSNGELVPGL